MKITGLLLLSLMLVLAACAPIPASAGLVANTATAAPAAETTLDAGATTATVSGSEATATPWEDGPNRLAHTAWRLASLGQIGSTMPVLLNTTVTLEFGADGKLVGHSGCNSYGGAYTVQDEKLIIEEVVGTLMACENQMINEQEQLYLKAGQSRLIETGLPEQ